MRKTLIFCLIVVFINSCAAFRKSDNVSIDEKNVAELHRLKTTGLINKSFFIQRAEITVGRNGQEDSFIASCKFCRPDTFLLSLRSKTGLEAARIFMTNDTILINDRINRVLLFGSGEALEKKYGYSYSLLELLFGGVPGDFKDNAEKVQCVSGEAVIKALLGGIQLLYVIDCNESLIKRAELKNTKLKSPSIVKYSVPEQISGVKFFKELEITNLADYETVNIVLKKVEIPYNGRIEFIPGRNFEWAEIK